jgi:hypothetical protein
VRTDLGDLVAQGADALDFYLDGVPRLHGADAVGSPGGDDIARQQSDYLGDIAHQIRDGEDEVGGADMLLAFAVQVRFKGDIARVKLGLNPGAGRGKGVRALGPGPLRSCLDTLLALLLMTTPSSAS